MKVLLKKNQQVPRWNDESSLSVHHLNKKSEAENQISLKTSLSVSGFQKVGIIGASGAGKSTLIDILSGFSVPNSGLRIQ